MGSNRKRPDGYVPFLELYLRRKAEGGKLLSPGVFRGALDAIARRSCLVMVHGFNNNDSDAAGAYAGFRSRQQELFPATRPFTFDRHFGDTFWPGDADFWSAFDRVDFLIYPLAVRTAIDSARELADLLGRMPRLERVDFIAHSLGARVTLETILLMRKRATPIIGRVCLMAAAVPSEMLEPGGRFHDLLMELSAEGTQVLVLHSKQDKVLHLAFPPGQAGAGKGEGSTRALGRFGPTPAMPGHGATLADRQISGAAHGDYWGHSRSAESRVATETAGRFFAFGELSRDVGTARTLGARARGAEGRDVGVTRMIAETG